MKLLLDHDVIVETVLDPKADPAAAALIEAAAERRAIVLVA